MSVFKGLMGSFLALFGCFMITTMLIRLANGRTAYIGLSDMIYFFNDVDFIAAFKTMISKINSQVVNFQESLTAFGNINDLGSFFSAVGDFFKSLFYVINIPVTILLYILKWVFDLISILARFFDFACGFNLLQ